MRDWAIRPEVYLPDCVNPLGFAWFTSGCFLVKTIKNLTNPFRGGLGTNKTGSQVLLNFKLTQHIKDKLLMESFISYFNCGKYYSSSGKNWGDYSVVPLWGGRNRSRGTSPGLASRQSLRWDASPTGKLNIQILKLRLYLFLGNLKYKGGG